MKITIFTPTYNRVKTLPRVYNSLIKQTDKNFEWIIIDDGSEDNTKELVQKWINEKKLEIKCYYQKNQGKHIAHNKALKYAKGEYFTCLDSDDECTLDAIKTFKEIIKKYNFKQNNICGLLCNVKRNGRIYGKKFSKNYLVTNFIELRYKYKIKTEKWFCFETKLLRKHPFPEKYKNTYIPESLIWDELTKNHSIICVNKTLRIYHDNKQGESIMKPGDPSKNSLGRYFFHKKALNEDIHYFKYDPLAFFISAILYIRMGLHQGRRIGEMYRKLNSTLTKTLFIFLTIPSTIIFYFDKMIK